jgi:hypothetical protein
MSGSFSRILSEAESFLGSYDVGTGDVFNFGGGSSGAAGGDPMGVGSEMSQNPVTGSAGGFSGLLGGIMGSGGSGGLSFLEQGFAQIFVNLILLIVGIILMVKAFGNTSIGKTVIETTKSGAKSVALAAVA